LRVGDATGPVNVELDGVEDRDRYAVGAGRLAVCGRGARSGADRCAAAGSGSGARRRRAAAVEDVPLKPLVLDQLADIDAEHLRAVDELAQVDVVRALMCSRRQ